jgi:hypothetical protein
MERAKNVLSRRQSSALRKNVALDDSERGVFIGVASLPMDATSWYPRIQKPGASTPGFSFFTALQFSFV